MSFELFAQSKAPQFTQIYNPDSNSSLSMKCDGKPPYNTIDCEFQQVSLWEKSEAEISKEITEKAAEFNKVSLEELDKNYKWCSDFEKQAPKFLEDAKDKHPGKKSEAKRELTTFKLICDCYNSANIPLVNDKKECYRKALVEGLRSELNVCSLTVNTFKFSFKKISQNKWMTDPIRSGMCNIATIATIEHEVGKDYAWSYYQSRVQTGELDSTCKSLLDSKPSKYTWLGGNRSAVNCKFIKFGL